MAHELVLRGGLQIIPTPGSGTGDPQLTLGISTKLVGEVPAVDSSTFISKTLAAGNILVGSNANVATAVSVTGAISISSGGITTLQAGIVLNSNISASAGITYSKLNLTGSIVDADISASAAIVRTKLAAGTAYRLIVNNSSGIISELSALTAAKVLVSDANGQPIAANPSTTEINFVAGVTSAIQTQLGNRLSFSSAITPVTGDIIIYSGGAWTRLPIGTAGQVLNVIAGLPAWGSAVANGLPTGGIAGQYLNKIDGTNYNTQWSTLTLSKVTDVTATFTEVNKLSGVTTTTAQFNYLSTATSDIQTQLNSKLSLSLAQNAMWYGNGSNVAIQLSPGITGYVLTSVGGVPTWQPSITLTNTAANNELPKSNGTNIIPSGIFSTSSGNITTGVWQATVVAGLYGGTGVANSGMTITLGGNLTTSGAFATTLTVTGITTVTLPTSGTLMANPMTTVGDLIQGNTAGAPVNLASVATGNALISGGVATLNSWGKITSAHVDATVQTAGLSWILASGGTLTGANTIDQTTTAGNIVKFLTPNLGVTSIDGKGLWIQNATAAAAGAQQISGGLLWEGQGWATTPVASQSVKFMADVLPVQGAANPTGMWRLSPSINGTAYSPIMQITAGVAGSQQQLIFGLASSSTLVFDNGQATFNIATVGTGNFAYKVAGSVVGYLTSTGFVIGNSSSPQAKVHVIQPALSSSWLPALRIDPGAHTSMTAATEFKDYNFTTRTATWLAGTTATQRFAHFQGQTVAGASASATFTDLYTVYIDPSIVGSNAVVTNNWGLGVGGNVQVRLDQNAATFQAIVNNTSGTAAYAGLIISPISNLSSNFTLATYSVGYTTAGINVANTAVIASNMASGMNIGNSNFAPIKFWVSGGTTGTITSSGNWLLAAGNPGDIAKLYVLQSALSAAGGIPTIRVDGGAHTNLTASAEVLYANLNSSATVQYATGAQTILRNFLVQAPTIGFVGASTITDNATFTISGAPKAGTNTTQTNTHGLLIQAGAVTSAGSAFGLTVNAPTGGTLNYAAQTKGGSFLFAAGTTTYAPIIIPTGTNLTTSAAGALENDGTHLWFTFANSGARWQLDNQVGTFGWALAGNTLVADGIIGDVGTGGFKISLYTNNTAKQVISSKGNFTFTQDTQSVTNTFIAFNQAAHTGGEPSGIIYTGGSHTGVTTSANFTDILFNTGGTISTQFVTGNLSLRSMFQISGARLLSFVGASTITDASSVDIFGAPQAHTNATFTNVHALLIRAAATVNAGAATNSYGLTVNAQTGATSNYSAQFLGGLGIKLRQAAQSTTHTFIDIVQATHTAGAQTAFKIATGGGTGLSPGGFDIFLNTATQQFVTGAVSIMGSVAFQGPTWQFVGASTVTDAYATNLSYPQAHNNATFTNAHALLIQQRAITAGTGAATNSYGASINAATGATNNYAAQFLGGNVGIGLSAPLSGLDVAGSFGTNTRTITTSATLAATDHTVLCDSTGGVVAATLPAAAGAKGRIYVVKKIDASANNVTLATVDGGTKTITTRYSGFAVQSDGSLWYVIASF